MSILLITWGILSAILIVLLIYRNTLRMREDSGMYLDPAEAHIQKEQAENSARLDRMDLPVRLLAAASGLLLLAMAVLWFYQGWHANQ